MCPAAIPRPTTYIGVREGDNPFTGSVVVLDAKTGAYKTHFQLVTKDWHDWDVSNPPVSDSNDGRQEADGGRAEGWLPLRL